MADLEMSCATDIGLVRKTNQDAVAVFPQLNLAVLADGMGGHKAGEVASRKSIEVVRDAIREGVNLGSAVCRANAEVFRLAGQYSAYKGMGTTLVAVQYDGLKVNIANVGDSRLYRYRNHKLYQITSDQTVAEEMREAGIDNNNGKHISSFEHVLTNALGIQAECEVVQTNDVMRPGDIHLLCSDGLSGVLEDDYIERCINKNMSTLEGMSRVLLDAALRRSAHDNVSVALVRSNSKPAKPGKATFEII